MEHARDTGMRKIQVQLIRPPIPHDPRPLIEDMQFHAPPLRTLYGDDADVMASVLRVMYQRLEARL
ncbi:hypothetical protein [Herbaspirillum chlorophenolicum]|uniref:hypothetical protein n=1 Tax=Herbaspirillum chlorophenolicum TaxID=211589 RepID=UPI0012E14C15|nr:hypothetical protein [Herbaspirillum chlorophenolicum]